MCQPIPHVIGSTLRSTGVPLFWVRRRHTPVSPAWQCADCEYHCVLPSVTLVASSVESFKGCRNLRGYYYLAVACLIRLPESWPLSNHQFLLVRCESYHRTNTSHDCWAAVWDRLAHNVHKHWSNQGTEHEVSCFLQNRVIFFINHEADIVFRTLPCGFNVWCWCQSEYLLSSWITCSSCGGGG